MISRWDRGRHRRREEGDRRSVVVVLLALVAIGGVASLVALGGGSRSAAAPAPPVPALATVAPSSTPVAVQACETTVARARDAVASAQPSYSHWAGHVRAQLDYDAGTATLAQTRARWASTKATADADLAQFATAYAAYQAVQDGCGDQSSSAGDPVVAGCHADLAAASAAVTAGKAVVDDWAAHVAMMKGKEHTDPTQYGRMWRDMVRAAPADLDRFAQASLAMSGHTACPRAR